MWSFRIRPEDWLDAQPNRRWILGTGPLARQLSSAFDIAGFIDDCVSIDSEPDLPVISSRSVPKGSVAAIAAGLRPISAANRLNAASVPFTDYFALCMTPDSPVRVPYGWEEFRADLSSHLPEYLSLLGELGDLESVTCLTSIMNFRCTGLLEHMRYFRFQPANQYFENFLRVEPATTFVDVGSFDGATSLGFVRRYPSFKRVIAIEPEDVNAELTATALEREISGRFEVVHAAAGSARGSVSFSSGLSDRSRIDPTSEEVVPLLPIDDLDLAGPLFVKIDIEGAEEDALLGMASTISRARPILAVAAYHRGPDFRQLPNLVRDLAPNYTFRMRHYTEGIDETVLFALPARS